MYSVYVLIGPLTIVDVEISRFLPFRRLVKKKKKIIGFACLIFESNGEIDE